MRARIGSTVTAAGVLSLVMVGGPMLAIPVRAAGPVVVVRQGDTLGAIADRYRVSVERLAALNRIADPDLIFPGQRLRLEAAPVSTPRVPRATTVIVHVVRPGENLTAIAARYGVTVSAIAAANRLASANVIYPGQRLRIAVPSASAPAASASQRTEATAWYMIRAGDTLTAIAARHATSVALLVALNHLANASQIVAGRRLRVPVHVQASAGWSTRRLDPATRSQMAARAAVRDLVVAEARRAGVPVPLALAVAWQESGWRQGVVSSAGAIGVMQLLPTTADWVAAAMLGRPVDLHSTRQNVQAGVTLLHHYLLRYRGDWRRALAAYYQGQRAVDEHGIFPVSRPYIASILALERLLEP